MPIPTRARRTLALSSVALLLNASVLAVSPLAPVARAELKTGVVVTEESKRYPTVNENDLKQIDKGTLLEMSITTSIEPGLNMEGDEFYGKVTKDYCVDDKVVIPRGTIVHGTIDTMEGPKRGGRNGYIVTKFDYLITPDGREIPIEGGNSTRDSKGKAVAKVVARGAGYTLAGGLVGALLVVKYGGLAAVAASNGYALAGGAGVGAVAGLTAAALTKGKSALIQPGAEIKIKLQDSLVLPTVNMPDEAAENLVLPGLTVNVNGIRIGKDPFGENTEITLSLDIVNQTENTFSFFDMALQDENGTMHYASPFGDTGIWFQRLQPNGRVRGNITFSVDNAKLRHKLVFFKQYTRQPIAEIALTSAMMNAAAGKPDKKADARRKAASQDW